MILLANARCCDRCGEFFLSPVYQPLFVGLESTLEKLDLCENCKDNLILWFIGRNHGKETLKKLAIFDADNPKENYNEPF